MDPRTLDLAAFLAALCIVIAIAFIVNSPAGQETPSPGGQVTDTPGDLSSGTAAPAGEALYSLPSFLSRDERKWLISRQVSSGMDYYLPATRDYAVSYISPEHAGAYTIQQACDIWDKTISEWTYTGGSGGLLDITPASSSINTGLNGDGADYAVFLASMLKGAGGESRIKTGVDSDRGEYAYAELYLGNSDDYAEKIISPEKMAKFKSDYSPIFAKDPSGLSIFKYRYGRICSGDTCFDYTDPFLQVMNDPGKYGEICYTYPELIEYLIVFPDTNVIEFQTIYIQLRYGTYDEKYGEVRNIRNLEYSYDLEDNGDTTYWLGMDLFGAYPGDVSYKKSGSATVYYSDGSYKSVRLNTRVSPVIK